MPPNASRSEASWAHARELDAGSPAHLNRSKASPFLVGFVEPFLSGDTSAKPGLAQRVGKIGADLIVVRRSSRKADAAIQANPWRLLESHGTKGGDMGEEGESRGGLWGVRSEFPSSLIDRTVWLSPRHEIISPFIRMPPAVEHAGVGGDIDPPRAVCRNSELEHSWGSRL